MTDREYLFSLEQIGIKLGLRQIRRLLGALDCPDLAYRTIVVAGTNGKGSVTAMLERGLRAAGHRTGRYISPHLVDIEERVAIDGVAIDAGTFDRLARRVRAAATALPHPPSFFEATTALALEAFREAHVDVAVLEVGLGGRLDATNAVTPMLSVITQIDLDHQQYLGDTIEAIAAEKAGIIKPGITTVLGANGEAAREIIRRTAEERGAPLIYAPDGVEAAATLTAAGLTELSLRTPVGVWPPVALGLRGRHQIDNAVTATRALETLDLMGLISVPAVARQTALEKVLWPARLEMRHWRHGGEAVSVLIDGAHNPAGARALAAYLAEAFGRPLPVVLGAMSDKDLDGVLSALAPAASAMIFTAAASARAARPEHLRDRLAALAPALSAQIAATPYDALVAAARLGAPVVVAGSLYLAGEVRAFLA